MRVRKERSRRLDLDPPPQFALRAPADDTQ